MIEMHSLLPKHLLYSVGMLEREGDGEGAMWIDSFGCSNTAEM